MNGEQKQINWQLLLGNKYAISVTEALKAMTAMSKTTYFYYYSDPVMCVCVQERYFNMEVYKM